MSLLMDALKKAEEAKRQAEAAAGKDAPGTGPASRPSVEAPAGEAAGQQKGLPELPSRLELLDDEFNAAPKATPAQARPKAAAEAAQQKERAAAQNLFEAKQPPPRRAFPVFIGIFVVIAAAGIGTWFWWQMQSSGGIGVAPGASRPAPQTARAPIAPPPQSAATPPAPAAPAVAPAPALPATTVPQAAAAPERPARPVARAAAEPPPEPDSPIRITTGRLKLNPVIAHGYQALMEGDIATAQRDYVQVLKSEPKNIDALHGLAAIDIRQGRFDAAENHYLRALESDPKDAAAQAGLVGLRGQVDPVQSESRLKILLAGQPDSPFLNFALGNLYARQGRWNEAQQAYFRAYSGDPDNPDYQFNLAISLDQLRQPKLALQYYQGALAAAAQRPAAFDKNQATGRVRELQQ